ncbi:MAG TPA: CbiX/SirB N-terminal domain-containing protein [Planctomycetota bacterium]|jgi:sirohydrochlorin ferrochelatase|nr:CbiX/SirB N-terminal domain-containing protein [Planctomycetota bacterium]
MTGLIVVDHGSKLDAANQMLEQAVELMMASPGFNFEPILAAHMDLASPSIAEAMAQLYTLGVREVIVFPYFLSPGRHTQEDIPRLTRDAAAPLPGMKALVAEPFGLSPKLIDAALQRIRACRDAAASPAPRRKSGGTTRIQTNSNRTTRRMKPQM